LQHQRLKPSVEFFVTNLDPAALSIGIPPGPKGFNMNNRLEAGMSVFLNRDTLEFKSVLDWAEMLDSEPWEEMTETIEDESKLQHTGNYGLASGLKSMKTTSGISYPQKESFVNTNERCNPLCALVVNLNRKST
jgi:hypothetical protein